MFHSWGRKYRNYARLKVIKTRLFVYILACFIVGVANVALLVALTTFGPFFGPFFWRLWADYLSLVFEVNFRTFLQ